MEATSSAAFGTTCASGDTSPKSTSISLSRSARGGNPADGLKADYLVLLLVTGELHNLQPLPLHIPGTPPLPAVTMASQADYKDRQFLAVIGDEVSRPLR